MTDDAKSSASALQILHLAKRTPDGMAELCLDSRRCSSTSQNPLSCRIRTWAGGNSMSDLDESTTDSSRCRLSLDAKFLLQSQHIAAAFRVLIHPLQTDLYHYE